MIPSKRMKSHFTAEFFKSNREKLRSLFTGTAPIVITANGLVQRNADTTLSFRQDSNFWYLTGLNNPDLTLVIDKGREYLILPWRDPLQDIFDGKTETESLSKRSGINAIFENKEGWKQLKSRLNKVRHIATISPGPVYVKRQGFYTNPARAILAKHLIQIAPNAELLDLRAHFIKLRSIKQPEEINAIQSAIDITTASFKSIKTKLSKYQYEYQIEADLTRDFRRQGASGHSYEPIVAGGLNTCTLHYVANNDQIDTKKLLLIDAGAEVDNYAADITRTYSLKEPTKKQRLVYEAVQQVQIHAVDLLKPGVSLREYEQEVENFMGEKLRELQLIKSINRQNVRQYYPHGTSHFLGLDAHDIGDYKKPLEPNMVLTVEPGIYIQAQNIGVRLEDDVLITDSGNKVLSRRLPKQLW